MSSYWGTVARHPGQWLAYIVITARCRILGHRWVDHVYQGTSCVRCVRCSVLGLEVPGE